MSPRLKDVHLWCHSPLKVGWMEFREGNLGVWFHLSGWRCGMAGVLSWWWSEEENKSKHSFTITRGEERTVILMERELWGNVIPGWPCTCATDSEKDHSFTISSVLRKSELTGVGPCGGGIENKKEEDFSKCCRFYEGRKEMKRNAGSVEQLLIFNSLVLSLWTERLSQQEMSWDWDWGTKMVLQSDRTTKEEAENYISLHCIVIPGPRLIIDL